MIAAIAINSYSVRRAKAPSKPLRLRFRQAKRWDSLLLLLRHLLISIGTRLSPLPLRLARALTMLMAIPTPIMIMLVWPSPARATGPACGPRGAVVGLGFGV
jgi:hypothetical protein